MARLSAELVVSLLDGVSGPAAKARTSLTALQRAERDVLLARNNQRLSRVQLAEERLFAARDRDREERFRNFATYGKAAGVGLAIAGYAAGKAYRDFSQLERVIGRIIINAGKPAEAVKPTIAVLQDIADQTRLSLDDIVSGLETLVASGRSLEESLAFLPAVAMTAQASGSAVRDIGLTADALAGSLGITADRMQEAFDILVEGGKAGKFELKDMAAELPALAPAFAQLGFKGTEGLKQLVAMLQVARNQTGSSSEAATNFGNVLQKVYSRETAANFKKFGIDLTKVLDKTRRDGGNIILALVEQTNKALKGDLSKLPLLFTDAQVQKGVRALMTQLGDLDRLVADLGSSAGSTAKDFRQITDDSDGKWQRLVNNIDRVSKALGEGTADVLNPWLDKLSAGLSDMQAFSAGMRKMEDGGRDYNEYRSEFRRQYQQQNPDAWFTEANRAFDVAIRRLGRGEIGNVFDPIRETDERRRLAKAYREAGYQPARGWGDPVPTPRPRRRDEMSPRERIALAYAEGGERYPAGRPSPLADDGGRSASLDAFLEKPLQVDGKRAAEQVAQSGGEAASNFKSGIGGAGASFGAEAARSFIAGVSSFLKSASRDLSRPVGSLGRSTGQQIMVESQGQAIDFGGRR